MWSMKKNKRQKIKKQSQSKKKKRGGRETAEVVVKTLGYQPFQGGTLRCLRGLPKTRPTHPLCSWYCNSSPFLSPQVAGAGSKN